MSYLSNSQKSRKIEQIARMVNELNESTTEVLVTRYSYKSGGVYTSQSTEIGQFASFFGGLLTERKADHIEVWCVGVENFENLSLKEHSDLETEIESNEDAVKLIDWAR